MNTIKKLVCLYLLCACILPLSAQQTTKQAAANLKSYFQENVAAAKKAAGTEGDELTKHMDTISGRYSFSDINKSHPENDSPSETAKDVKSYITEMAEYAITGNVNSWEHKRRLLYRYVQDSNWLTKKDISRADHAFMELLKTLAGGLFEYAFEALGWDLIGDRMRQKAINEYESNEQVQYIAKSVANDISDLMDADEHTVDALYIKIQHNAFELLTLNYVDFCKVVAAYPEVGFLFDDLYMFFKWRFDLRTFSSSYAENENNIDLAIRKSAASNSFLAWWELANTAKEAIRWSIMSDQQQVSTQNATTERDNIDFFKSYAKRSLYFGRLWNGIQRYAVKQRQALPNQLNPKRGAFKGKIKRSINKDMQAFSNEQVVDVLTDIRARYVSARIETEAAWEQWVTQHADDIKALYQMMLQRFEERNPERARINDEVTQPEPSQEQQHSEQVLQEQMQGEVLGALQHLNIDVQKWQDIQTQQFKRSLRHQLQQENLI